MTNVHTDRPIEVRLSGPGEATYIIRDGRHWSTLIDIIKTMMKTEEKNNESK